MPQPNTQYSQGIVGVQVIRQGAPTPFSRPSTIGPVDGVLPQPFPGISLTRRSDDNADKGEGVERVRVGRVSAGTGYGLRKSIVTEGQSAQFGYIEPGQLPHGDKMAMSHLDRVKKERSQPESGAVTKTRESSEFLDENVLGDRLRFPRPSTGLPEFFLTQSGKRKRHPTVMPPPPPPKELGVPYEYQPEWDPDKNIFKWGLDEGVSITSKRLAKPERESKCWLCF